MKYLKFHFKLAFVIILTLGLSISLQSLLATWQSPTSNPPSANIDKPLNTGTLTQGKLGGLNLGSALGIADNLVGPDLLIEGIGVNPELSLGDGLGNYWSIYSDEVNSDELRFWRGDDRMALTGAGTLKIREICDENGANCVDVSTGIGSGLGGPNGTVQTPLRNPGTTYQNNTGYAIMVFGDYTIGDINPGSVALYYGPLSADQVAATYSTADNGSGALSMIVPNGWFYRVVISNATINTWYELR